MDSLESQGARLLAKRLAANDTLASGSHQAGPYIPKNVAFELFPSIASSSDKNPRVAFDSEIVSHHQASQAVNIIWYNNKSRNECHITGWGGAKSKVLDPDSTGSLCLFGFLGEAGVDIESCMIWLCTNLGEEDQFETRFDIVEPGRHLFLELTPRSLVHRQSEFEYDLPSENLQLWRAEFYGTDLPTGKEFIEFVVQKYPETASLPVDNRLVRRRELEYLEFQRLEKEVVLPRVKDGFNDVNQFVDFANAVTNRRKSRSGKSLELHMVSIFEEEGIQDYAHDKVTEGNKRPDFIFPSIAAYRNMDYPSENLQMLACKTTCKDRWRQIIDEARRIPLKYLLTLQQGVSESQFSQIQRAGIKLVVPKGLHASYPRSVRPNLETVESFISIVRRTGGNSIS